MDTSAPTQKFETLRQQRQQTHDAEMSWVRSVLGPKCLYTTQVILWLLDNLSTGQLSVSLVSVWSTHWLVSSPTATFENHEKATLICMLNVKMIIGSDWW